jgi:hypothetical protein
LVAGTTICFLISCVVAFHAAPNCAVVAVTGRNISNNDNGTPHGNGDEPAIIILALTDGTPLDNGSRHCKLTNNVAVVLLLIIGNVAASVLRGYSNKQTKR